MKWNNECFIRPPNGLSLYSAVTVVITVAFPSEISLNLTNNLLGWVLYQPFQTEPWPPPWDSLWLPFSPSFTLLSNHMLSYRQKYQISHCVCSSHVPFRCLTELRISSKYFIVDWWEIDLLNTTVKVKRFSWYVTLICCLRSIASSRMSLKGCSRYW